MIAKLLLWIRGRMYSKTHAISNDDTINKVIFYHKNNYKKRLAHHTNQHYETNERDIGFRCWPRIHCASPPSVFGLLLDQNAIRSYKNSPTGNKALNIFPLTTANEFTKEICSAKSSNCGTRRNSKIVRSFGVRAVLLGGRCPNGKRFNASHTCFALRRRANTFSYIIKVNKTHI